MLSSNKFIKVFLIWTLALAACTKIVDVSAPYTSVSNENVFTEESKAISVLTGIYSLMSSSPSISGTGGIGLRAGLSGDELTLNDEITSESFLGYFENNLAGNTLTSPGGEFWTSLYGFVFKCNDAIHGLESAEVLSDSTRKQLLGEAKFLRAFFYFYLTNLYGDVPLILTTDYEQSRVVARDPKATIYLQIVEDLKDAQNLLSQNFLDGKLSMAIVERVRPTNWAATALLARVYLYLEEWSNAEREASTVISNSGKFGLTSLNAAFLKNSREAIWQLQPVSSTRNTQEGFVYNLPATWTTGSATNPVYLSQQSMDEFEDNDQRAEIGNWIGVKNYNSTSYYYPYKYKVGVPANPITSSADYSEYLMIFRLAELYLIKSEALAKQNKISESLTDLNIIRQRAGLTDTTTTDGAQLMDMIAHERRTELFTEWGHRWLDLKRTGMVDAVMSIVTPIKSSGLYPWRSHQQLYPLPIADIERNLKLTQNPGY